MRIIRRLILGLLIVVAGLLLGAYFILRSSLPELDGERHYGSLKLGASIVRDSLGVPLIRATSRSDVAWATGYAHAQDRFFQMDLSRRFAAGELAELFGSVALENDRRMRLHRFRRVAREVLARATPAQRALVDAYVAGVNAGLDSLGGRPFEYWLLRAQPAAWRPEDTVLVVFAMYEQLNYSEFASESSRGLIKESVPAALYSFLYRRGTEWDAPLLNDDPGANAPLPTAAEFDLRAQSIAPAPLAVHVRYAELPVGSNNWAVAGTFTQSGAGLLANDMHLGLSVPNTWYRARWQVVPPDANDPAVDVTGVTLPGVPLVAAGSNGRVAWGFTNSYGDWLDLVVLREDPSRPGEYATPTGFESFETAKETIKVHGRGDESLEILATIWGPVFDRDRVGRRRAAAWIAQEPEATNFELMGLESAGDVQTALDIAARSGAPPQNFVAADQRGNIGWTIMGRMPLRGAYDYRVPSDWSIPGSGWQGWVEPQRYPRVLNPPDGRVWTANARVVGGEALQLIGDASYAMGARARQIRDDLMQLESANETDMLAIQLDERADFLLRWQGGLLALLDDSALHGRQRRAEFRELVEKWGGRASVDSVSYRLVRAWRNKMQERVFGMLTAAARLGGPPPVEIEIPLQFESALWELVSEEPMHLLGAEFASWRDLKLQAVDAVIEDLLVECGALAACTWGGRNRVEVSHPLARAIPLLGRLLNMPLRELPGDVNMPRVQAVRFGASERFAVTPGHESQGYFHMPAGQSGHPLSAYYRAGDNAWAEGQPLPFLPGPAVHRLTFEAGR